MQRRGTVFQSGLLAAILAATLHFVLWTAALAAPVPTQAGGQSIALLHQCAAPGSGGGHGPSQACVICPLCLTHALGTALPAPAPATLPPTRTAVPVAPAVYAAIAPPGRRVTAASPRGPPSLS